MAEYFDDLTDWMDDAEEIKDASVDVKHGKQAVSVSTRKGNLIICPHCGEYLTPKDIYTDKKGWTFCRACFRKGHGSIRLDDSHTKKAFAFEYELPPEDEFDMDKVANFMARGLQLQNPAVIQNSRSLVESRNKALRSQLIADAQGFDVDINDLKLPAALLTPLIGAGAGYLSTTDEDEANDDTKSKRALKGLLSGAGAVGGAALGSKLTQGDVGTGILGGAAGGTLAYLLSKGLLG